MNNNQATISKMQDMRMHGMARAFQTTLETGMHSQPIMDRIVYGPLQIEFQGESIRKKLYRNK